MHKSCQQWPLHMTWYGGNGWDGVKMAKDSDSDEAEEQPENVYRIKSVFSSEF